MFVQNLIHRALSQSLSLDFSVGTKQRQHEEAEIAQGLA